MPKPDLLRSVMDVSILSLNVGSWIAQGILGGAFVASTVRFQIEGALGNIVEMNNVGVQMYATGLGTLALHLAVTMPASPLGPESFARAHERLFNWSKSDPH